MRGPRRVVVVDVLRQNRPQMLLAVHHNMIETFASTRSNQPLGIRVLPRRTGRNYRLPNVEGYHWVMTLSVLLALISAMSAAALIPGKPDGERRSFIEE